eukprot:EG_transcript_6649
MWARQWPVLLCLLLFPAGPLACDPGDSSPGCQPGNNASLSVTTPLTAGHIVWDSITGFGAKHYTFAVPHAAFLDTVVVVDRGDGPMVAPSTNEICRGWSVYLTVNETRPEPQPRYIERQLSDIGEILLAALVQMQQQSVLCTVYSAAKWSVKDAAPGQWWVMVQTRGATEVYDNSTCHFGVWVNSHNRTLTLWTTGALLLIFAGWLCWTLALAALPALHPDFHVYRPSILLHEFLLRLPADLLWGTVFCGWRAARGVAGLLRRRPRAPLAALPLRRTAGDADRTELAVLVEPQRSASDCLSESPADPDPDLDLEPAAEATVAAGRLVLEEGAEAEARPTSTRSAGLIREEAAQATQVAVEPDQEDEDCCRICRDNGTEEPLIEPCACQGSMRYVHATCLNKWRQESLSNGRHENALRCEVCNEPFHIVHPPITCRSICRSCGRRVGRGLYYAVAYAAGAYGWSWFIKATVGRASCAAPYNAPDPAFGWDSVVLGVLYYGVAATHLYVCIYWQWVLWLNSLRGQNPPAEAAPARAFYGRRNVLLVLYFFFSLLLVEVSVGYAVQYLFFLVADNMVWVWDLPLTVGFVVVFMVCVMGSMGVAVREAFGGWPPALAGNLGTVVSRQR